MGLDGEKSVKVLRQWLVVGHHQQALAHQKFNSKVGMIVVHRRWKYSIRIDRGNRATHQNPEIYTASMQMNRQNIGNLQENYSQFRNFPNKYVRIISSPTQSPIGIRRAQNHRKSLLMARNRKRNIST